MGKTRFDEESLKNEGYFEFKGDKNIDEDIDGSKSLHDQFLSDLLESTKSNDGGDKYSQKVVEALTQSILTNDALEDECAICLDIPDKNDLAVTPCHHIFCKTCLVQAL